MLGKAVPGAISLLLAADSYPNYASVMMTMQQIVVDARWQSMYDTMQAVGVLPAGLDYHAAYTLQFVDRMGAK